MICQNIRHFAVYFTLIRLRKLEKKFMTRLLLVGAFSVFFLSCSENNSKTPDGQTTERIFDTQIDSLDKAKEVEKSIQDAVEKQRRRIEEQEG